MVNEVWKKIPGIENYEASSLGRVRSLDRTIIRVNRWGRLAKFSHKGRVLNHKHKTRSGYYSIALGAGAPRSIHRLVCSAFHGIPKPGQVVSHKNGIRTDNRSDNLEWSSVRDNVIYGRRMLNRRGRSKSMKWAIKIIVAAHSGTRVTDLARRHGVARQTVSRILSGRMYPSKDYPEVMMARKKYPYSSPKFKHKWLLG